VYVTIEADDRGRISIGTEDESGAGNGYRIAGMKFCSCHPGKTLARRVLTKRDAEEIRRYLDLIEE